MDFMNLTSIEITEEQKYIFYLCQKFCPTPQKADWAVFETNLDNWAYMLRWAYKFGINPVEEDPNKRLERTLIKKTNRTPIANSGCPALELYINLVTQDLLGERTLKKVHDNIHPDHRKTLNRMKHWDKDKGIILRPQDKGDGIVIDTKANYKERVLKELSTDTYKLVEDKSKMSIEVKEAVTKWADKWADEPLLTEKVLEWIIPEEKN